MIKSLKIRVAVLLINEKNEVLVVRMHRNSNDIYVLPGGGLEHNESLPECAVREVYEETNLNVVVDKLLYYKDLIADSEHLVDITFLGNVIGGDLKVGFDPEDKGLDVINDVKWVKLDELQKLNFHPKQLKYRIGDDLELGFPYCAYLGKHYYPEE